MNKNGPGNFRQVVRREQKHSVRVCDMFQEDSLAGLARAKDSFQRVAKDMSGNVEWGYVRGGLTS